VVYPIGIVAWWIRKKFKVKYLISEHWTGYFESDPNKLTIFQKYISKKAISKAEFILPVSNDLAKEMKLIFENDNYEVVPNVIDTSIFTPLKNFTPKKTQFVHISSFDDSQKNITGILKAIKKLSETNLDFEFTFISDGEIIPFVEYAKRIGIPSHLINFQTQKTTEEIAQILQKSACLVMFSNYETFSIVIAEALACGVPVIATQVGGLGNELTEKEGITIQSGNEAELIDAMKHIIYKTIVFNQIDLTNFAAQFSYEKVNLKLNSIYDSIINK
jgi:glycosyltransferase involved in cell wall biosynthesis